jgi:MFS family permease
VTQPGTDAARGGLDPLRMAPGTESAVASLEATRSSRLFNGPFLRLWLAQVVASLGDWIGLVAILAIADRLAGGGSSGTSIGVVMLARMAPGFFLGSVGGVLVDRWNRKRVLVLCNLGRAAVLCTLPFVDTVWGLVLVSLALEIMTLLWSPAKEAEVPNLVSTDKLSAANSLSLGAAYGTFPVAAGLSAVLFKLAGPINDLGLVDINRESVAIYFNAIAFLVSAVLIWTIHMPRRESRADGRINLRQTLDELKDGWRFIGSSPIVQAVMIGLATGLFGGGMVVPLGPDFSRQVLGAGAAGFSLLYTALGLGVAVGVLALGALQRFLPRERLFVLAAFGAGTSLLAAATVSTLSVALLLVGTLGIFAGASYVLGFTLLQENVSDELRGRIFATLYTVIRLCLLGALTLAPFLSQLLDGLSRALFGADREVAGLDAHVGLPGVRLTLWFGGAIIVLAGLMSARVLGQRRR